MKVICTDNFNRDYIDDELVSEIGLTDSEAKSMADKLNEGATDTSPYWYRAVPDDYKLKKFEP